MGLVKHCLGTSFSVLHIRFRRKGQNVGAVRGQLEQQSNLKIEAFLDVTPCQLVNSCLFSLNILVTFYQLTACDILEDFSNTTVRASNLMSYMNRGSGQNDYGALNEFVKCHHCYKMLE